MSIISGVYLIKNKLNGKIYIGSSIDICKRWSDHRLTLRQNRGNPHFNLAYHKYGKAAFTFHVLERVEPTKEQLLTREQYYLDLYKSYDPEIGYNINPVAGSPLGSKLSEAVRRKISRGNKGKILSLEQRLKIGASSKGRNVGRKHTEEELAKMRGRKHTLAEKKRMRGHMPWNKGKAFSEEHRRKLSIAHTGKKLSEIHKLRIRRSAKRTRRLQKSNIAH